MTSSLSNILIEPDIGTKSVDSREYEITLTCEVCSVWIVFVIECEGQDM
jgi:hypothetical protein